MKDYLGQIADFIFIEDEPEEADIIVVCGSARTEPALRAAELFCAGYCRRVLPTGRFGERFRDFREEMYKLASNDGVAPETVLDSIATRAHEAGMPFPETEWEYQRNELILNGVPKEAILKEDRSVNTFENAVFSRKLLEEQGIKPGKMILCCQAFHARRAMMTFATEFTETQILVCPGVTRNLSRDTWLNDGDKYDKVMDELKKCGSYFAGERMYRAARDEVPASGIAG